MEHRPIDVPFAIVLLAANVDDDIEVVDLRKAEKKDAMSGKKNGREAKHPSTRHSGICSKLMKAARTCPAAASSDR